MPAIPKHTTPVVDGKWDASANVKRIPGDATESTLKWEYAWRDPDKDADTKGAYKFPHHEVSESGTIGAANLNGVRNALARLTDADVPEGDKAAIKAHLDHHLAAENKDARGLVTRSMGARSVDVEARTCDFVASTNAVDSYGDIVEQSWDLKRFKSNPVILYAHDSRELPIGTATRCEVVKGQLECTIKFCTEDMNPLAEQVWKMVQSGVLRAVSVGFIPNDIRYEKRDGEDVCVLGNCELHEISVVPIPANHEALAKMKAAALASAEPTNPRAPTAAAQELVMNEVDYKALLATRDAELAAAKTARENAEKAVRDGEATIATLTKQVSDLTTAKGAVEAQLVTVAAERDAATKRSADLSDQLVERDVEALVGFKIAPAQKDSFLALAKKDKASFDAIVATLPDMKLAGSVVPLAEKSPAPPTGGAGNSDDLVALMNEPTSAA